MARATVRYLANLISNSCRPLLLVGNGARGSDYLKLKLPVITTRLGIDLIDSTDPYYVGRPGLVSDRVSHFAIQEADLIICIGARLDTGIVGYNPKDWGRKAIKIVVDIDKEELYKNGVKVDIHINMDAKRFVDRLLRVKVEDYLHEFEKARWLQQIYTWQMKYPLPKTGSYKYIKKISDLADKDDIVVVDTSSAFHIVAQVWKVKKGQQYITTGGISTMGYWPASIGAHLASGKRVICVTGDGCMQMNIQELATVVKHKLNIKIFLLNNNGYLLIRHTQRNHLDKRLIGEGPKSGLSFPNFKMIAKSYGIPYTKNIKKALSTKGPILCEIKTPYWEALRPRIMGQKQKDGSFKGTAYEDLWPYVDLASVNHSPTLSKRKTRTVGERSFKATGGSKL